VPATVLAMQTTRVTSTFEITSWDQTTWHEADGIQAGQARVTKTFTGDLEGASVAQVLLIGLDGEGAAYTAQEVISGTLGGRTGSFALQHGATAADGDEFSPGVIIPGSGRGELAGIRGTAEFRHDDSGARLTLEYDVA
jgi:hypothetical protein